MKARAVIQIFPDGQKNVCLTQDPLTDPDDYIVGNAEGAIVIRGEVIIISEDPRVAEALLEVELRSVDNTLDIVPRELTDTEALAVIMKLGDRP